MVISDGLDPSANRLNFIGLKTMSSFVQYNLFWGQLCTCDDHLDNLLDISDYRTVVKQQCIRMSNANPKKDTYDLKLYIL